MIVTSDYEGWYENLISEHDRRAEEALANSGTRSAESVIVGELKQIYRDRSLQFTIQQAMALLCARLRQRVFALTENTTFSIEKREVYYRFLAVHSKKGQPETPLSIYQTVREYIYNRRCTSPMEAYCIGQFVQFAVFGENYSAVHPLTSTTCMREWLLKRIDFFETVSLDYRTRQEAISAFIYILGIFH